MNFDLNKLIRFAQQQAVSFQLFYGEASNTLSIEIVSNAETENFSMKKVPDIDYFIEEWYKHVKERNSGV